MTAEAAIPEGASSVSPTVQHPLSSLLLVARRGAEPVWRTLEQCSAALDVWLHDEAQSTFASIGGSQLEGHRRKGIQSHDTRRRGAVAYREQL
jgi:hypothetical protein